MYLCARGRAGDLYVFCMYVCVRVSTPVTMFLKVVRAISNNKPGVVEMVLLQLKQKIDDRLASRTASNGASTPSSDAPEMEPNGNVSVKVSQE